MEQQKRMPRIIRENQILLIVMVLVFFLMSALNGQRFFALDNIASMAYQLPILGCLAMGMMVAMLSGGINLAIIATANFNGIVIALVLQQIMGPENMAAAPLSVSLLAIAIAFVFSMLVGVINGLFISLLKIPDILVTLGTMTIIAGLNVALTSGYTISGFPKEILALGNGHLFGIPSSLLIFIFGCAVCSLLLNRTQFGSSLYMMGSNPKAARFSNINIVKVSVQQYMLSSFFAVLTSLVMIGQLSSVKASYADSYLLVSILAGFLGNVNPFGGFGKVCGMVISVIILQFISSGLNLMSVDSFMITAMWGMIIVVVVVIKGSWPKIAQVLKEKKTQQG